MSATQAASISGSALALQAPLPPASVGSQPAAQVPAAATVQGGKGSTAAMIEAARQVRARCCGAVTTAAVL
jgi:hypothetical protein